MSVNMTVRNATRRARVFVATAAIASGLIVTAVFSQLHAKDQIAEGDKVVTRWSFTGIHRGNLMGIAPTGKQVTSSGVMIDRVVGGKITEEWEEYDALGMMQQLGAVGPKIG